MTCRFDIEPRAKGVSASPSAAYPQARACATYALVAALVLFWVFPNNARAAAWTVGIQLPVIVNIYDESATPEEVGAAIDEANKLLEQAGMKLVVVPSGMRDVVEDDGDCPGTWGGDDGSGGGTAGDGIFTPEERAKVRAYGDCEVKKLPNRRGIKIAFANDPGTGRGVSVHRNPTLIVRKSTAGEGGVSDTGQTIAHELGHIMTLGANHTVDEGPPKVEADDGGHSSGADDIMQETAKGDEFTDAQKEEIRRQRYDHGKCSTQWSDAFPATKDKQGYGAGEDAQGDQGGGGFAAGSPIYDLISFTAWSLDPSELGGDRLNINAHIMVDGVLPSTGEITASYSIGFDIDDNLGTGITYAGMGGVDRIARIDATGDIGLETFSLSGEVEETAGATTTPIPTTIFAETDDEFDNIGGVAVPTSTSFLFKIPKALLNFSVTDVPMVITAGDGTSIFDTMTNLVFNSDQWLDDPDLLTFGTGVPTPGASYPFEIAGLTPNDPFELYLDNMLVVSDVVDGTGAYSGSFIFPAELSEHDSHFLTALDTTDEFAFSFTCPRMIVLPSISNWGLFILVLLLGTTTATLYDREWRWGGFSG